MSKSVCVHGHEREHAREHDLCLFGPAPLLLPAASGPGSRINQLRMNHLAGRANDDTGD